MRISHCQPRLSIPANSMLLSGFFAFFVYLSIRKSIDWSLLTVVLSMSIKFLDEIFALPHSLSTRDNMTFPSLDFFNSERGVLTALAASWRLQVLFFDIFFLTIFIRSFRFGDLDLISNYRHKVRFLHQSLRVINLDFANPLRSLFQNSGFNSNSPSNRFWILNWRFFGSLQMKAI